jgi:DNA-binding transcriptional MerR regulator
MKNSYTIAELSAEFGVTARAIRFYEDRGLIVPTRKGNRRVFSPRDRVRLRLILRGKRVGLTLDEIREVIDFYDVGQDEIGQMQLLLEKLRHRREALLAQRHDIDVLLDALESLEANCTEGLIALRDGGKLPPKLTVTSS